jgi:hypothetical protein
MKKNLVLLLSLCALAACALTCAAAPVIVPTQPEAVYSATVSASPDKVYDAFVKYFADKGYVLDTNDRAAGTITTIKTPITDKEVLMYFKKVATDTSGWRETGARFDYCDCGLADIGPKTVWKNLFYSFTVNIKKVTGTTTEFTVKTRFWAEVYRMRAFAVLEYQNDWDCASTGQYETKLIEEIKAGYLK